MYGVLPFSFAFLSIFNRLAARLTRKRLFNAIVLTFLAFFALFGFVLFPNHYLVHPHGAAEVWLEVLPPGLAGGVAAARNWTFSLFYCSSEMWGDVGISLLFWSLANETTSMRDAAVLYPLFGVGANVAQVIAGQALKVAGALNTGGTAAGNFQRQLQGLVLLVLVLGACILAIHEHISRSATFRPDSVDSGKGEPAPKAAKPAPRRFPSLAQYRQKQQHTFQPGDMRAAESCDESAQVPADQSTGAVDGVGATGVAWAGQQGGVSYVTHARQGPGVVMQIMDGRCHCVWREDSARRVFCQTFVADQPGAQAACDISSSGNGAFPQRASWVSERYPAAKRARPKAGSYPTPRKAQAAAPGATAVGSNGLQPAVAGEAASTPGHDRTGQAAGTESAVLQTGANADVSDGQEDASSSDAAKAEKPQKSFLDALRCALSSVRCCSACTAAVLP